MAKKKVYKLCLTCELIKECNGDLMSRCNTTDDCPGYRKMAKNDGEEMVDHPSHYNGIPGVECIDVVRHMNFNVGNAVKYLWRAGLKSEEGMTDKQKQIEDLKKAIWYINDEIKRIEQ